ncbi:hypothetical protein pb186bvf_013506 [Paramecium bursaria]
MILFYLFSVVYSKSLAELSSILNCETCEYRGVWIGNDNPNLQNQFDFLTETKGDSFMLFLPDQQKQDKIIQRMRFELLNPTYQELKQVIGDIKLKDYDEENMKFEGQENLNYTNYYKYKKKHASTECNVKYLVQVQFNGTEKVENALIDVKFQSIDISQCKVDFSVQYRFDTTNYLWQIISYCVFSMAICFTQFICVTRLCKSLLENEQDVSKISIISVGYITVYDSYVCLQNLYFALINYAFFQYFILPAFFYFMLATTCDMKLIWILWRSRHMAEIIDQQQMRKAITIFFAQFYFSLIGYFILMYFFELENWFICLTGLVMIPQVIHNVRNGNNPKFIYAYIFGILCPSMLYPIYARGCPSNIRGMEPSNTFIMVYFSLYLFQILLLYIQYKLGPRAFIPRCFLPKQFQYYHIVNLQDESDDECAICLGSILDEPAGEEDAVDAKLLLKQIMITPCKHKFHISCLKSWIDVKLQCPTCRQPIPPIAE